jgi:hypothetical protein
MECYGEDTTSCCTGCNTRPWANKIGVRVDGGAGEDDDANLANEMNAMSAEDREKVFDDIHGVAVVREETAELLLSSIRALDRSIQSIRHKNLTRAMFLRPELETDIPLKLMFLRATEFGGTAACKRLCAYFDAKCQLFGEEKLVKDITLSLSDLTGGGYQTPIAAVLPKKDQAGRSVLLYVGTQADVEHLPVYSLVSQEFTLGSSCVHCALCMLPPDFIIRVFSRPFFRSFKN